MAEEQARRMRQRCCLAELVRHHREVGGFITINFRSSPPAAGTLQPSPALPSAKRADHGLPSWGIAFAQYYCCQIGSLAVRCVPDNPDFQVREILKSLVRGI